MSCHNRGRRAGTDAFVNNEKIDAALDSHGIKSREQAIDLARRARAASKLSSADALDLALDEQRAERGRDAE